MVGGAALIGFGIARRSAATPWLALLGGLLIQRGIRGNCPVYQRLGFNTNRTATGVPDGKGVKVEKTVFIAKAPAQVYACWRDLENLPKFMPHVRSIKASNDRLSHWRIEGPAGYEVAWDAEIINDHPGEMIAWQTLPGAEVQSAGTTRFEALDEGRATRLTVQLKYQPPAGRFGAVVAGIFGESPDRQLEEDLRRFKTMIETDGRPPAMNDHQPQKLILLPPTHEQSTPSFHVTETLAPPFLDFLRQHGITAWQPPKMLEKQGPEADHIVEIEIEADTPVIRLETLAEEFLEREALAAR